MRSAKYHSFYVNITTYANPPLTSPTSELTASPAGYTGSAGESMGCGQFLLDDWIWVSGQYAADAPAQP